MTTKSMLSTTLFATLLASSSVFGQRNQDVNKSLCTVSSDCSDDDVINRIQIGTIDNVTTCSPNGYGDYRIMSTNIVAGTETHILAEVGQGFANESLGLWIDYNNDDNFTADEFQLVGNSQGFNEIQSMIRIPAHIAPGNYTARFFLKAAGTVNPLDGCNNTGLLYGEFEDYTFNITAAPDCNAINTINFSMSYNNNQVCEGDLFEFEILPRFNSNGITTQLQSSTDNGTTWTNINTPFLGEASSLVITEEIILRSLITCSHSQATKTTSQVLVTIKDPINCYCTPVLVCSDDDVITKVELPSLNYENISSCGHDGYSSYTNNSIGNFEASVTYPIKVTVGDGFTTEAVSVWIDYNQNGTLDQNEFTFIGTGSGSVVSGNITIPATAILGETLMRVRVAPVPAANATDDQACEVGQGFGETEDYKINIVAYSNVEKTILDGITLAPNPTNGLFKISGLNVKSEIQVTDISGRVLLSSTGQNTTIDLSSFSAGTYNVMISTGTDKIVKRIVKN